MQFRTQIQIEPSPLRLTHSNRVMMIGSCFSEHIAERMVCAGFHVANNPFGILFNPASIVATIERLASGKFYTIDDLLNNNDRWFSYDFHGDFAARSAESALTKMNRAVEQGAEALAAADCVVLTLGTSWIYRLRTGGVVANCHKMSAQLFERELLSVEQIVALLDGVIDKYLKNKWVVLSISPVRHIADGLDQNSLSKAILRVAVEQLVRKRTEVSYFPSFEIMNDDLRDYRFYERDMVHPSSVAIDYIWECWRAWTIDPQAEPAMREAERVWTAAKHRPSEPDSQAHREFCEKMLERIDRLVVSYPATDWQRVRTFFAMAVK